MFNVPRTGREWLAKYNYEPVGDNLFALNDTRVRIVTCEGKEVFKAFHKDSESAHYISSHPNNAVIGFCAMDIEG